MPRTSRPRAKRAGRSAAVRGPSERWLRALVSSSDAARRFFDPDWYLVRHPDLLAARADPFSHYADHGAGEGRDPSPLVSATWYAELVPDVGDGRVSLLEHLVSVGEPAALAPSPFVDADWYRRRHPDVDASGLAPLEHLWRIGLAEGRPTSPYLDLAWYAAERPDVARSGMDPFTHFVTVGHGLGWWAHPLWDEEDYRTLNPSVRAALAMRKASSGFEHFCGRGALEVVRGVAVVSHPVGERRVDHVERRYLQEQPDVAEAVSLGHVRHGLEHLFADGHREIAAGSRTVRLEPAPRAAEVRRGGASGAANDVVVLLAHHDPDRRVDEHVERAIAALVGAGAAVHVVSSGLEEAERERILPSVASVIVKADNTSALDFGSWALALDVLGAEASDRPRWLVLANDSSYFPVRDPGPMLAHLRGSGADLWAATDSLSWGRHHLQSYFLALGPRARVALLPRLRERLERHSGLSKIGLVQRFEVGMTRDALRAGLDLDVFRSVRDVLADPERVELARHRPAHPAAATITNLTHHLWRGMLREHGLPFLKVELLRDNPLRIDVAGWQAELDPDWVGVIERHLARVRRTTP